MVNSEAALFTWITWMVGVAKTKIAWVESIGNAGAFMIPSWLLMGVGNPAKTCYIPPRCWFGLPTLKKRPRDARLCS